jgi:Domain of unknown function (DUF4440)
MIDERYALTARRLALSALALLMSTDCHAVDDLRAWFQSTTQALYDAVAPGDKAVWDRVLDANSEITTEDGEVFNKTKFLKQLEPLPPGSSGHIRVRDLTVQMAGTAAVVHYWLDETEDVFEQQLTTTYVETDVYKPAERSWKMVAAHTTVVPRDLDPVPANSNDWPALVGDYRVSDKSRGRYRVFMRDGALFGGRDPRNATLLIPLSPLVFFQKGSIHIMVFVQDKAGVITEVRELHKYNELRMRRVTSSGG